MADTVQYLLEQMVPELEDLEKRGLFSRDEIKQIVKKRTNFEYLLKRRAALKEDYERYVEYETKLEALRRLRKSAIVRKLKAANLRWRCSLADRAVTRRIMFIYERAVRKFKGDLRLWLKYMEFCRAKGGTRQMQKVATKALQLHPTIPGLWMYAASWEFEHNLNESAARALMQQGLRMCPKSESLWLEYLRLELTYVQKLKARQALLGAGSSEATAAVQDGDAATAGTGRSEGEEAAAAHGEPAGSVPGTAQLDALSTSVAKTVFRSAVAALPQSPGFRKRFLDLLQGVDFQGREEVEEEVLSSLARDFPDSAEALDLRARRAMQQASKRKQGSEKGFLEAVEAAVEVFEQGVVAAASAEGYQLYSKFLEEKLQAEVDREPSSVDQSEHASTHVGTLTCLAERLAAVYQRAHAAGMSTQPMGERHVALLMQGGQRAEALQLVRSFCEGQFSTAGSMWALRLSLALEQSAGQGRAAEFWGSVGGRRARRILEKALKAVPLAEAVPLWRLMMECMAPQEGGGVEELLAMAAGALAGGGSAPGAAELACAAVTWALHQRGVGAAREVCDRLLALPGPSSELVQLCARLEAQAAASGDPEALPRMRKAFAAALDRRGTTDSRLWLEYCRLELQVGSSTEATAAYWRAKKTLHDPSDFLAGYQQLVA